MATPKFDLAAKIAIVSAALATSSAEAAKQFEVSASTIARWKKDEVVMAQVTVPEAAAKPDPEPKKAKTPKFETSVISIITKKPLTTSIGKQEACQLMIRDYLSKDLSGEETIEEYAFRLLDGSDKNCEDDELREEFLALRRAVKIHFDFNVANLSKNYTVMALERIANGVPTQEEWTAQNTPEEVAEEA